MSQARRDSELQHSFAAGELGFDFVPLEEPKVAGTPVKTLPGSNVPNLSLSSDAPLLSASGSLPLLAERERSQAGGPGSLGISPARSTRTPARFWLDGDAIMCACPECHSPVTVRSWLLLADCWNCGTSIEIGIEQEREIDRLRQALAAPLPAAPVPSVAAPAAPRFREASPASPITAPAPAPKALVPPPPPPPPRVAPPKTAAAATAPAARRPLPPRVRQLEQPDWISRLLKETPAWLVSMLVHLILITLLALFTRQEPEKDGLFITLSSLKRMNIEEGGETLSMNMEPEAKFDLPLPRPEELKDPKKREVLVAADQAARELRLEDNNLMPRGDLAQVKNLVSNATGSRQGFVARDPRLRVEMVKREGGTTLTEAAVARGLFWLSNHQESDGSYSLTDFHRAGQCNCGGRGHVGGKCAGTALALLPFLGAGQTHQAGKYQHVVSHGLQWLVQNQAKNGDLRAGDHSNAGMYAHGQATIVLCEAFAMTGDESLRVPAQKAVDFIVAAQYRDGGWRYTPGPTNEHGDTSVVGWQVMALQSARAANLSVPEQTIEMADRYLDTVASSGGARYAYQRNGGPTHVMTAEGLLCRIYLGWKRDNPALRAGIDDLLDHYPPRRDQPDIYYWYYGTQTMHHFGGEAWQRWNESMRECLVGLQEDQGHVAGSWAPRGPHAEAGGRIYMTSLAVCSLEVYYRHLPIFRQIKID